MAVFVADPRNLLYRMVFCNIQRCFRSALEIALRPKNTLFLFIINVGAILIYYVVTRLILEQNQTLELEEKNHQLSMQAVQYENLQEKSPTPAVPSTMCGIISRLYANM